MKTKAKRGISRALVITPKGYAILRAVERGTYKFAPSRGGLPAGTRIHKGKRRSKFKVKRRRK